jgi:hypothetical protein
MKTRQVLVVRVPVAEDSFKTWMFICATCMFIGFVAGFIFSDWQHQMDFMERLQAFQNWLSKPF